MSATVSDTRTVTLDEAAVRLDAAFRVKRPVFIWGPPGIGKSELIHSLMDSGRYGNAYVIDWRLPLMEPTDIRGIPYYNSAKNVMDWAPPVELPDAEMATEYDTIVLFLDEMNAAPPSVQAAAYQLILNRRIGKYRLPDNVVIVAAGNRESDKGVTYRMPSPLANRFVHLEVRSDFTSWFNWATTNNIHPDVVGYISFAKQDLFEFNPRSASRSFATPRSWTFVSQFCNDDAVDNDSLTDLVSGCVGEGLAVKFMAHRKVAGQMPKPEDILAGKVKELKVKEVSAQYSLTVSMCYELKDALDKKGVTSDWHKMVNNFFRFMMDNFETELVVMGARVALKTYNLPFVPKEVASFAEFHARYGKYISAAVNIK